MAVRDRRILVVEDEYILARDFRDELANAGAVVLGPEPSVGAALARIAKTSPSTRRCWT